MQGVVYCCVVCLMLLVSSAGQAAELDEQGAYRELLLLISSCRETDKHAVVNSSAKSTFASWLTPMETKRRRCKQRAQKLIWETNDSLNHFFLNSQIISFTHWDTSVLLITVCKWWFHGLGTMIIDTNSIFQRPSPIQTNPKWMLSELERLLV